MMFIGEKLIMIELSKKDYFGVYRLEDATLVCNFDANGIKFITKTCDLNNEE